MKLLLWIIAAPFMVVACILMWVGLILFYPIAVWFPPISEMWMGDRDTCMLLCPLFWLILSAIFMIATGR